MYIRKLIDFLGTEKTRRALAGYLFIAPHVVPLLLFTYFAIGFAFYLGFQEYDLLSEPLFNGLENYRDVLRDRNFMIALKNTLYYTAVVVPFQIALALLYAVLLNQSVRLRSFFRAALYTPTVTASVVVSLVFIWLYFKKGILNYVLSLLGIAPIDWLNNPATAMPAVMLVNIWYVAPTFMIIFLAALQEIPRELLEAAMIDGASAWGRFRRIILPLLRPSIFFASVMGTIWGLQVFDQIYIMTEGGPVKSTMTISYLIYMNAFRDFRMGYAAALAFVLFGIIFVLSVIQRKVIDVEIQY